MGRPINKKYFGNRNTGSATTTSDDGIGGKGVASIALTTPSAYQTRPTFTITAPTGLRGTTATGTITSEVLSATVTGGTAGTDYAIGDLLTISTPHGQAVAYVATVTAGAVATVNFTGTGATRGTFETLPAAGVAVVTEDVTPGTGCTLVLTFRAKAVEITDPGSGYRSAPTVGAVTQGVVLGAVAMTPAVGADAGSALNPDLAILAKAFTGGSVKDADIVKQRSSVRYNIITADTASPVTATLKTSGAASAEGEMTISATDSLGKTYYIARLTAHKAFVVPYGAAGHEFPLNADNSPKIVGWTLGSAVAGTSVQIESV
jgi:hypothetical protein